MDSRTDHENGFSIPELKEFPFVGSWGPSIPGKPIPVRSNLMPPPVHRKSNQMGRVNWQELPGIPSGYAQELYNCNGIAQNFGLIDHSSGNWGYSNGQRNSVENNALSNEITGPYTKLLFDDSLGWSNGSLENLPEMNNAGHFNSLNIPLNRSTDMATRPFIPILQSQVNNGRQSNSNGLSLANQNNWIDPISRRLLPANQNNWREPNSGGLLLASQNNGREHNSGGVLPANQTHYSNSELLNNYDSSSQRPPYGFLLPFHCSYRWNSLPAIEANATSNISSSIQITPRSLEQAEKLENDQFPAAVGVLLEKSSSEEKDKQQDLVVCTETQAGEQNFDALLHNRKDSSSAVMSTPLEEPEELQRGSNQGIDLNKTPQQKTPKRRKHRPKVIVEGKPKRPPKTATTKVNDSNEKPTGKRKYERKKGLKESTSQPPESSATNKTNSNKKLTGNREYVDKSGLNEPATQNANSLGETACTSSEITAKSCRRALNFQLEINRNERQGNMVAQQGMVNQKKMTFNLNTAFQAAESSNGANMMSRTRPVLQRSQQNGLLVENQQSTINNHMPSVNQMWSDFTPERRTTSDQPAPSKNKQMENPTAKLTDTNTRLQQHIHAEGIGQVVFPAKNTFENLERTRQPIHQNIPQLVPKKMPPNAAQSAPKTTPPNKPLSVSNIPSHLIEGKGSNRDHYCIEQKSPHTTNLGSSSLLCHEIFHRTDYHQSGSISGAGCSETHKKKKVGNGMPTNTYAMSPSVTAVNSIGSTSSRNTETFNSNSEIQNIKKRENSRINRLTNNRYIHLLASQLNLSKQFIMSEPHSTIESMEEINGSLQIHSLASSTKTGNCNILPPTPPKTGAPGEQPQHKTCNADASGEQITESILSKSDPSGKRMPQGQDTLKDHSLASTRRRGRPPKQKFINPIEEIICRMDGINLNKEINEMEAKEKNALVPYKGDGAVIPYEGKKAKPRPKVDLDPETDRVWKLLMGKEGTEGFEGTDKEKEQWWEKERRVFRGRADSFIAKMHLVQGDRRFSKWKGSVVDSVIGVFLTQNVSDHLSSSAFMSLAAQFPPKSMRNGTCDRDGTTILVEEPDVCIVNPNDTIKRQKLSYPLYNKESLTPIQSAELHKVCEATWLDGTSKVEPHSQSLEEEILSSQDSFDSSVVQGNGVRSSSGSNSEAEDIISGRKSNKSHIPSLVDFQRVDSTNLLEEFYSQVSEQLPYHERSTHKSQQPEDIKNSQHSRFERLDRLNGSSMYDHQINYSNPQKQVPVFPSGNHPLHASAQPELVEIAGFKFYGEESITWPSSDPRTSQGTGENSASRVRQGAENIDKTKPQQYKPPRYQESQIGNKHSLLTKQLMHQQSNYQTLCRAEIPETNKPYQLETTTITKSINPSDAPNKKQNSYRPVSIIPELTKNVFDVEERNAPMDKQVHIENKVVEPNLKEQAHSTNTVNMESNSKNGRKRKAEGEKDAVDWDNLRKSVQTNGRIKERTKDTMDSLDYEALRSASVNQIANAIKERGMNNMLAERIKEFLNRLVKDHGSIDLEWLRDVPPDTAKDYLLSIRGLGLKSVECVRLLTLHNLAFPVDTNVGRIAVRLGWVPLQPLPESLQIHLLELYPVLESIQKYLWPRLCKLDQRTLYELHYQMITFGKVFCTKSKPNCKACPMRAECRHFASAFASEKLKLPGPEEKSIMTSAIPLTTERNPGIVINPMPLPSPEDNTLKRAWPDASSCVPIIEEPASPEQENTDTTESDIEDAFFEDPDEIPTIKLNVEEFTVNLQNFMQTNTKLQEGDMSKALMALNPEVFSVPPVKLKNVSRLRTEHQVYELPDSHPLLKEMDRREPDDPSPYLLAIWTPGETANSFQPPEQCQSQELGKLCNEKTCFSCNGIREANSQIVRGTLLIPCRTAMRGSFPLNGTYFQVNEMFADHESSLNPIDVPRAWIWNLPRRMVYFGTSVSTIFKDLSTEEIQYCFWKGFVCVRGFDQKTRAPRPLMARLHFPASKLGKTKNEKK